MQQIYRTAFALLSFAFCLSANPVQAQKAGCDGIRYKQDVFTSVKKTTVQYSTAPNYLFNSTINLFVDVYEPAGDSLAQRPVVVLAHGGSFIFGDKSMMQSYCEQLAKKGYVAASIQYRLYPALVLGFPDSNAIIGAVAKAMGDMKAAVRFFREDAATVNKFHVDADNIFVGGYSAGAVTALHMAYLDSTDVVSPFIKSAFADNGGLEGNSGSASNKTYASTAKAVVNMSGGLYRRNWLDQRGVPLVSIHGTADGTVPYLSGLAANIAYLEGSGLLHPRAGAVGVPSTLETVQGGGHTDIYDQPQFAAQLAAFWTTATTLLESLTCALVDAGEPFDPKTTTTANWRMYPNPATSTLRIELPDDVSAASILVFDPIGRLAMRTESTQNQAIISLATLPEGLYTIQVSDLNHPEHNFAPQRLIRL